MFQHLFVPVDGSELSHRAMDSSIALALKLGARITGFVAEPDLPLAALSSNPATFTARIQQHDARTEAHASALLGQFEQRAREAGIEFKGLHLRTPAVDQAIADAAEQAGCDMIVMVTHGRGAFGELLFGSHTKNVLSRSKVPLLVLH